MMKSSTALLFLTLLTASLLHQLTANKCPKWMMGKTSQKQKIILVDELVQCSDKCGYAGVGAITVNGQAFESVDTIYCDDGSQEPKTCISDVLVGDCKCHYKNVLLNDKTKVPGIVCCFDPAEWDVKKLAKTINSFKSELTKLLDEKEIDKFNKDRARCKGHTHTTASDLNSRGWISRANLLLHITAAWLLYAASF